MTNHDARHDGSAGKGASRGIMREFGLLAILIAIGMVLAAWLGLRDGRTLAAAAYGIPADDEVAGTDEASDNDEEGSGTGEHAASASSPEAVARGAALFQANCAACHGDKADGKGPAAVAFTPPPRDFTDPNAKWTQGRTPADIFASVTGGVPGTGMAGFGGALTEAQRWDLVHYIASLPGAANSSAPGGKEGP